MGDCASSGAPPTAAYRIATVVANDQIAQGTYRLRFRDTDMARAIRPGQFVMVRPAPPESLDPLLGRPFALYEVARDEAGEPFAIDVIYVIVGRGTTALADRKPDDRIAVWGPLGNGFGPPPAGPVVFVAGGIGQTPFLALGRWWLGTAEYGSEGHREGPRASSAALLYGVRSASHLAGVEDFAAAGIPVEIATDDGSAGHSGFVTDLLARRLDRGERPAKVVGCGPPVMLRTLSRLVEAHGIACDLSLENHMACGFGACFSCVTAIRQHGGSTDLKRVCVEGPIFDARDVVF